MVTLDLRRTESSFDFNHKVFEDTYIIDGWGSKFKFNKPSEILDVAISRTVAQAKKHGVEDYKVAVHIFFTSTRTMKAKS